MKIKALLSLLTILSVVLLSTAKASNQFSSSLKSVQSAKRKNATPRKLVQQRVRSEESNFNENNDVISSLSTVLAGGLSDIKSDKLKGFLCILGGALAHLTLGTLYCWGNFISYAPDSLKFLDGKSHPGTQPDALYVMPVTLLFQAISMPFGPFLQRYLGSAGTMLFGSWLTAAAVFLSSFQERLFPFIVFYSMLFGTGVGLAYTAPMSAGWKYLPQNKGLVSGGILTGFGAGGFIFSLIGSKTVNPNKANMVNGKFPDEVYNNFPHMLRKLAVLYAALSFIGSLFITEPKPQPTVVDQAIKDVSKLVVNNAKNKLNDSVNKAKESVGIKVSHASTISAGGLTLSQALKSSQFWLMWMMIISSATAGLNTAAVYKQFAASSTALNGDGYQALVGGIGALFNGFGRLFWGSISDVIGFKNSFTILTILQSALMFSYTFSVNDKFQFAANTCMLFFCLAGNLALMPPATQRMFGSQSGTVIYGVLYSAFAIASIVGGVLTKSLVKSHGWQFVFRTMSVMSIVATVLVSSLKKIKDYEQSTV